VPLQEEKTRALQVIAPSGSLYTAYYYKDSGRFRTSDSTSVPSQKPPALQGRQVTVSENHPHWNSRSRRRYGKFQDVGGNFYSQKTYLEGGINRVEANFVNTEGTYRVASRYAGFCVPSLASSIIQTPTQFSSSDTTLDAFGAKAIAACSPTNSVADVSTFLGELLKDGLPKLAGSSIWKGKTEAARKVPAKEYLNYEFGWKPIVNDVRSILNAIYHANAVLEQYERDSGKMVRRRYEFPPERSESSTVIRSGVSPYVNPSGGAMFSSSANQGQIVRTQLSSRRRWFSGAFTYYLPTGYGSRSKMARKALEIKKLLGLSLTPDVLWELAPWSWAADWFANTGDVLSNVSSWAVDGLVLKYGYVMEHTYASNTYIFVGPTGFSSSDLRPQPIKMVCETKLRRKATPFGFGLTWGGLSPRQMAIAAALGISKGT